MSLQDRPKKRVANVGVALLVTGILLWSYLNRTRRANAPKKNDASAAPITMAVQPVPVDNRNPTSSNAQRHPLVEKLLTTEAGFVNRVLAMELVASLLSDAATCEAAISQLVKSESEAERILGHYLNHEKSGFSERMASEIKDDPSPYLKAEIADWLYLDRHFEEREQFISDVTSDWADAEIAEVLLKLNEFDGMLLLPPAMRSLGLGEGLPELIAKALRDDQRVVEAAVRLVEERGMGEQGKIALLNVLETANPERYHVVLVALLSRENENSHVRWKAIQDLAHMEDNRAGTQFLLELSKTSNDVETIRHIENMVNGAREHGFPDLGNLEDILEEEIVDPTSSNTLPKHLTEFAKRSLESNRFTPDRNLLVRAQTVISRISNSEQAIEKLKADIDFLIWRTSR
jgi:hypothetical protein